MDDDVMARRAARAALVGTALEWYDFILYGTASALVFNRLFFAAGDPRIATLGAFATFAVGFLSRPLGGIVFGHFGDRLGRKNVLVINLLIMGLTSTAIGLLPTYQTAGVLAPVLLVGLRLVQGFGAGAEYAGAGTLAVEFADRKRRGLFGSVPATGGAIGSLMSSVTFVIITAIMSPSAFLAWGWRVPFLLSIVLVIVAIYMRYRLTESPAFARLTAAEKPHGMPLLNLVKKSPRSLMLGYLSSIGPNIGVYVPTVFGISYATQHAGISQAAAVSALVVAYTVGIVVSRIAGIMTDRFGPTRIFLAGTLFSALMAFPFFLLVNTGAPVLAGIGFVLSVSIGFYTMIGAQGALLASLFPTSARYTGIAVSREFAAATTGGPAPLVAAGLLIAGGNSPWLVASAAVLFFLIAAAATLGIPREAAKYSTGAAADEEIDESWRARFRR